MKELLECLAKKILPHPDDFQIIEEVEADGAIRLTLITHPEDTGLAIGKEGRTARALRELLKVKAIQTKQRVYLNIMSQDEYEAGKNAPAPEQELEPTAPVAKDDDSQEPTLEDGALPGPDQVPVSEDGLTSPVQKDTPMPDGELPAPEVAAEVVVEAAAEVAVEAAVPAPDPVSEVPTPAENTQDLPIIKSGQEALVPGDAQAPAPGGVGQVPAPLARPTPSSTSQTTAPTQVPPAASVAAPVPPSQDTTPDLAAPADPALPKV